MNTTTPSRATASDHPTTLMFDSDELLYDIQNMAYIEGHKLELRGDAPERHLLTDICQQGNMDRVTRVLSLAHATVVEMLAPLSHGIPRTQRILNRVRIPRRYAVRLRPGAPIGDSARILLSRTVHEYMVGRVLADWLDIVQPTAAARWHVKVAEHAATIRDMATASAGSVHTRRTSPI